MISLFLKMNSDSLRLGLVEDSNRKDNRELDIKNKKKMSNWDNIKSSVKCCSDIKKKERDKKQELNQVNQILKLIPIMKVYKHIKLLKIVPNPVTQIPQQFQVSVIHQKHLHKKTWVIGRQVRKQLVKKLQARNLEVKKVNKAITNNQSRNKVLRQKWTVQVI